MEQLSLCLSHSYFDAVMALVGTMDNRFRKSLLILARHMGVPKDRSGNMYNIVEDALFELTNLVIAQQRENYTTAGYQSSDPLDYLDEFLSHPLHAGALIAGVCMCPYGDPSEEDQIRLDSFVKEIETMDRSGYKSEVSFAPFFGDYSKPCHEVDIPANWDSAKIIHKAIDDTILAISTRLQFPRYSKKPTTSRARSFIKRKFPEIAKCDEVEIKPILFERIEYHKRLSMSGPVQMKQRWYQHFVTPRTYYVGGETAFSFGRFMQNFSNKLCDALEVTNRFSRVQPWRLFVHGSKHALFYDLTSFTSNLPLQYSFLCDLANYCMGITIETVRLSDGIQLDDLGVVIREYAEELNHFHGWYSDELDLEGVHGQAGYLGVYGNIATATFLHGAILLMLCTSQSECSVAGDDAAIITDDDDGILSAIRRLGAVAKQKTYSTESDAIFLKRRTFVGRKWNLQQYRYVQIPSFLPFMVGPGYARFSREVALPYRQKVQVASDSLQAFFASSASIGEQYEDSLRGFATRFYRLLSFPFIGYVPQFGQPSSSASYSGFIPGIDFITHPDFVRLTIESLYEGSAVVPYRGPDVFPTEKVRIRKGMIIRLCGGSFTMTTLQQMGVVIKIDDPTNLLRVYGNQGLSAVLYEYDRKKDREDRAWKTFAVVSYVPSDWWPGTDLLDVVGEVLYPDDYEITGEMQLDDALDYWDVEEGEEVCEQQDW